MDYSDTYGNFLKGADIPASREFELTIAGAGVQEFNAMGAATGQGKQRKLVLSFRESTKLLVCNVTNSRTIADAYGSNTDHLPGKKICVSRTQTSMGPGILVRVPAPQAAQVAGDPFTSVGSAPSMPPSASPASAPSASPAPADGDFDKEIPF